MTGFQTVPTTVDGCDNNVPVEVISLSAEPATVTSLAHPVFQNL